MYSASWVLLVNKCTIIGQLQLLRSLANFRLKSKNKVISKGLFLDKNLNITVVVNDTKYFSYLQLEPHIVCKAAVTHLYN